MALQFRVSIWHIFSTFFVLLSLGCSLTSRLPLQQESTGLPPTRTPLPTFTPTAAIAVQLPISPVSTVSSDSAPPPPTPIPPTPAPSAPNDPPPTEPPPPTDPPPTDTPVPPPPTEPPPPPPPTEPPPPPPPAEPAAGAHGIIGKIDFRDGRNTYAVNERVFVRINARTPSGTGQVPFGILGLTPSAGSFQTSWSSGTIDGEFNHEDGVAFPAPGNHKLWLSICFSSIDVCQGPNGDWERFEPGLDVIIQ